MEPIKIRRGGAGWEVVGNGVLTSCKDLKWAAFDALLLAELQATCVELEEGVPGDALDLGRQVREHVMAYGQFRC